MDTVEKAPISEAMRESGIVEPKAREEANFAEKVILKLKPIATKKILTFFVRANPVILCLASSTVKAEDLNVLKYLDILVERMII